MSAEKDSYTPEVHARWIRGLSFVSQLLFFFSGAAGFQYYQTDNLGFMVLSAILFLAARAVWSVSLHEHIYPFKDNQDAADHT